MSRLVSPIQNWQVGQLWRSGGSATPAEERIAYVNSDGLANGVLNDSEQPFDTTANALIALEAAFPDGQDWQVLYQVSMAESFTVPDIAVGSIKFGSSSATPRNLIGTVTLTRGELCDVTFENLNVTAVSFPSTNGAVNTGHTIRGVGTAQIVTLIGFGLAGAAGSTGSDATGPVNGLPGNNGTSSTPPTNGDPGESVSNNAGNDATEGSPGQTPVSGRLRGTIVVSQLNAYGGAGGAGGAGGNASTASATGGAGGSGGDYTGTDGNGARGGDGGNATCNGGDGGPGGNGADGATWLLYDAAVVTSYNVVGGALGAGGTGGLSGTATAGLGGNGGNPGSNSGTAGDPGSTGTATNNTGANGADGTAGADGSVTAG